MDLLSVTQKKFSEQNKKGNLLVGMAHILYKPSDSSDVRYLLQNKLSTALHPLLKTIL